MQPREIMGPQDDVEIIAVEFDMPIVVTRRSGVSR
jgi:hypothetical protein